MKTEWNSTLKESASQRKPLSKEVFDQLFTEARSHHHWTDKPVADEDIKALYEIIKYGPTSAHESYLSEVLKAKKNFTLPSKEWEAT